MLGSRISKTSMAMVVGRAYVPVKDLMEGHEFEQWLELVNKGARAGIRVSRWRIRRQEDCIINPKLSHKCHNSNNIYIYIWS